MLLLLPEMLLETGGSCKALLSRGALHTSEAAAQCSWSRTSSPTKAVIKDTYLTLNISVDAIFLHHHYFSKQHQATCQAAVKACPWLSVVAPHGVDSM
jgi:hypothetical protein